MIFVPVLEDRGSSDRPRRWCFLGTWGWEGFLQPQFPQVPVAMQAGWETKKTKPTPCCALCLFFSFNTKDFGGICTLLVQCSHFYATI